METSNHFKNGAKPKSQTSRKPKSNKMKYTASRLSEGNKAFPAEIHCELTGLTVKVPGLFSGQSKHLNYNQIGEVSIDAPTVGYSTITFYSAGTKVSAHGFTKDEVNQIKHAIESGQANHSAYQSSGSGGFEPAKQKDSVGVLLIKFLFWPFYLIIKLTPMFFKFITSDKVTSTLSKGVKDLASASARKKALALHNELTKQTDDIDILLAQGKKDEALTLIKKLEHSSSHPVPNSDSNYTEFWTNKRKEYIGKATS